MGVGQIARAMGVNVRGAGQGARRPSESGRRDSPAGVALELATWWP